MILFASLSAGRWAGQKSASVDAVLAGSWKYCGSVALASHQRAMVTSRVNTPRWFVIGLVSTLALCHSSVSIYKESSGAYRAERMLGCSLRRRPEVVEASRRCG